MVNNLANATCILVVLFVILALASLLADKPDREEGQAFATSVWQMAVVCLLAIIILKM